MDQPTRPLPPAPRGRNSVGVQRGLFLLTGVAIGAVVVLVTLYLANLNSPKVVFRERPQRQDAPGRVPPSLPPDDGTRPPRTDANAANKGAPDDATSAAQQAKPNLNPLNLPDKKPAPMPNKQITGQISPGPSITMPTGVAVPAGSLAPLTITPEQKETPKTHLMLVRMSVSDTQAALQGLQSLASQMGGAVIQFDESAEKPDPEGAILLVPDPKADEAEKQLASVGSVIVNDHWTGSNTDRLDRVESTAQTRISDLRVRRQELLAKYLDDAPQIRRVDEDKERIQRSITAFRAQKPGAKTTVIKIKFLG